MPGVAKWSTPDNLETLRGKVRLRPLSCSPLLIKSSCNTETTTSSRRKFSRSWPALSAGSFMFKKTQILPRGNECDAVFQWEVKVIFQIMSVPHISDTGTNKVQGKKPSRAPSTLIDNSGLKKTDFRSSDNTDYHTEKIKITGRICFQPLSSIA